MQEKARQLEMIAARQATLIFVHFPQQALTTHTTMNTATTAITSERDEFVSEEFLDKNAPLPTVIVLNEQHDCGYFIPVSTMAKCGWIDFDETQLISHTFRSGETEPGLQRKLTKLTAPFLGYLFAS